MIVPLPGARELFSLDPEIVQLNHGSFGAVPIEVQQAQRRWRDELERAPDRFFARLPGRLAEARGRIAAFLGTGGGALVANATEGVAVALGSIPVRPGDEIIHTDHGYAAVELALRRHAAETGAVLVRAELGADPVAAITGAVTERTRIAVFDHVSSSAARLLPVARLVKELAAREVVTVVDGAHAPGMLPLDLDALGADFWVGNLHKWAFAPRPAAMLAVAPHWRERVRPLVVSYGEGYPAAVEWRGTGDYSSWLAAPEGLAVLERLGIERVRAHNQALAAYGQRVLAEALAGEAVPGWPGVPMRVVRLGPGLGTTRAEADALGELVLDRLGYQIKIEPGGLLRLSAQIYNTTADYDRLAERLPALLTGRR
ncbi:aminotransferase class V-fold PLP-dependent enzyme [Nonomuraea sp. NPDC050310]|uniref:aminotransferase class V-fold PLP-dependent enzyme n=1 Tax=Nonomuraea sp. NPDC050310 TaxID=3154935 RepID=UPI0033E0CF91